VSWYFGLLMIWLASIHNEAVRYNPDPCLLLYDGMHDSGL